MEVVLQTAVAVFVIITLKVSKAKETSDSNRCVPCFAVSLLPCFQHLYHRQKYHYQKYLNNKACDCRPPTPNPQILEIFLKSPNDCTCRLRSRRPCLRVHCKFKALRSFEDSGIGACVEVEVLEIRIRNKGVGVRCKFAI